MCDTIPKEAMDYKATIEFKSKARRRMLRSWFKNDFKDISWPSEKNINSWKEAFSLMDKKVKNLIVKVEFSDNDDGKTFVKKITEQGSKLVTDASYKEGLGAAALIWETNDSSSYVMVTSIVPTNAQGITSLDNENDAYRSELSGILIAIHLISTIEHIQSKIRPIKIYCDNEQSIFYSFTRMVPTTSLQHFDILKAIHGERKNIVTNLSAHHVNGHSDDSKSFQNLTRLEQLNVICDKLAKTTRSGLEMIDYTNEAIVTKKESYGIFVNESKVCKNFKSTLLSEVGKQEAYKYYLEKYNWQKDVFNYVDWNTNEAAMHLMSPSTRTWITKFVTNTLPLGKNMVRRKHWSEEYCPRCKSHAIETKNHLYQCQHVDSNKIYRDGVKELSNWLNFINTEEDLSQDILKAMQMLREGSGNMVYEFRTKPMREQMKLGLTHLLEGRLVKSFRTHQNDHYKKELSKRTGKNWCKLFVTKIWMVLLRPQWMNRNEHVHNLENVSKITREKEDLRTKIQKRYESNKMDNLLHDDKYLLLTPLKEIFNWKIPQMNAWIQAFDTAIVKRDAFYTPENKDHNDLHECWSKDNTVSSNIPSRISYKHNHFQLESDVSDSSYTRTATLRVQN